MSFTKYVKGQLSKGRKLNQIVTKITLRKATSAGGITFSQAVFTCERPLSAQEREAIAPSIEQAQVYAANMGPAAMTEYTDDVPFVDAETGEIIEPLK